MHSELNKGHLVTIIFVFFLLETNRCALPNGGNSEDLDTLNFDVFQETTGVGECPVLMNPGHGRFECEESRDLGISRRVEANKTCMLSCVQGFTLPLIVDTATRKSARPVLMNPGHGRFECEESRDLGISRRVEANKTCMLRCVQGFMLPLIVDTATRKATLLEETGVYRCFSNMAIAGKHRQWIPSLFFDCTPRNDPLESKLYFYLTLEQDEGECESDKEEQYARKFRKAEFDTQLVCENNTLECTWNASVRCVTNTSDWEVVITLSWPFNETVFLDHRKMLSESFESDTGKIRVSEQKNTNPKLRHTSFQVICPKGTRFGRDLTCHGCSVGNFMNDSTMMCQPCPPKFFQDEALQVVCNPCPEGSEGFLHGGAHITSCFKMHELLQETDLLTMTFCIGTVISVVFALLIFNNKAQQEEDDDRMASTFGLDSDGDEQKDEVLNLKDVQEESSPAPLHQTESTLQRVTSTLRLRVSSLISRVSNPIGWIAGNERSGNK